MNSPAPYALLLALVGTSCATPARSPFVSQHQIPHLLQQTRQPGYFQPVALGQGKDRVMVRVHHAPLAPLLREEYTRPDLDRLWTELGPSLDITLGARSLPRAADRVETEADDPTHYDAVWVRDSLWVYLGLKARGGHDVKARDLLLTLADYFASPAQRARFDRVIADPKVLDGPDGPMQAVHIRFDGRSPDFADVSEGGRPQTWNHKQNDALGLFLDLFCRAVLAREIREAELTPERLEMIGRFPRYFEAARFERMADAGSWEEIERVNTSSIALVTSGLERLRLARRYFPRVEQGRVARLIDRGYATVRRQLRQGGESPGYPKTDPRYRLADAALLNVIYPAQLERLGRADYERVLQIVGTLAGEVGIKRYLGDSYQSGNFWYDTAKTDDTSSDASFAERGSKFIPGSEAQWFFDSWYSIASGIVATRFEDPARRRDQIHYLNRALGQVTGGTADHPVLGGDGKPVPARALPESYNTIVDRKTGERGFVPSPITPLNWAKAAMRIALDGILDPDQR